MTARRRISHRPAPGQAMVEFALVAGLFMLVIGAIVQFGIVLWSQNAITEIARDAARYGVTLSDSPCDPAARPKIAAAADRLARDAALIGYAAGSWTTAPPISALGASGIGTDWQVPTGFAADCPPSDNRIAVDLRVRVNHVVPIFFPGLQLLAPPCSSAGFCLTTETELRMEPKTR